MSLSTQGPQGGLSLSPAGPAPSLGSFPPSQSACQLGAPLSRSVKEGTGLHVVPKSGAVECRWVAELGAAGGMSNIRGHGEGISATGSQPDLETPL